MLMKVCMRIKITSKFLWQKNKSLFTPLDDFFTFYSYRDDKGPNYELGKIAYHFYKNEMRICDKKKHKKIFWTSSTRRDFRLKKPKNLSRSFIYTNLLPDRNPVLRKIVAKSGPGLPAHKLSSLRRHPQEPCRRCCSKRVDEFTFSSSHWRRVGEARLIFITHALWTDSVLFVARAISHETSLALGNPKR